MYKMVRILQPSFMGKAFQYTLTYVSHLAV